MQATDFACHSLFGNKELSNFQGTRHKFRQLDASSFTDTLRWRIVSTQWEDYEQEWQRFSSSRTNVPTHLGREGHAISNSSVTSGPL